MYQLKQNTLSIIIKQIQNLPNKPFKFYNIYSMHYKKYIIIIQN